MNQQPKSVSIGPLAIIEGDGGRARMAVRDGANPVYDEMWEREKEELRREHQRLLYVAMTRARDHLVMIGTLSNGKKPAKENSWLSYLRRSIPALQEAGCDRGPCLIACSFPDWQAQALPLAYPAAPRPERQKKQEPAVDGKKVLENISPIAIPGSPEWKKATDFIDHDREESLTKLLPETGSQAVSPLTRGSVLHRCLESLTVNGTYSLEQITKEFPEIEALDKEAKDMFLKDAEAVLRPVIDDKDLAWIFERGPNAYSELPFLYRKGNTFISGIIDRVVIKGDTGFVIDYKAILIESDEALALWKDHYLPQIRIYCEAVKEIFRLPSVEGYLLFLDSNRLELTVRM
jgi:ATP-dependent helicase/nuclease subunit A